MTEAQHLRPLTEIRADVDRYRWTLDNLGYLTKYDDDLIGRLAHEAGPLLEEVERLRAVETDVRRVISEICTSDLPLDDVGRRPGEGPAVALADEALASWFDQPSDMPPSARRVLACEIVSRSGLYEAIRDACVRARCADGSTVSGKDQQ